MEHALVIAYGNPLRSDDGIAWHAADQLRRQLTSSARTMCVHQLTPELADDIRRAELVVFLDASRHGQPGAVRCEQVLAEPGEINFSHHLVPQQILGFCNRLYSATPAAFLISVTGENFDHGQAFSASVARAVPLVLQKVSELMQQLWHESNPHTPRRDAFSS